MKYWKIRTILLLTIGFHHVGYAESAVGNGGIGIVCPSKSGGIKSVELLDYVQGAVLKPFYTYEIAATSQDLESLVLSRLARISPNRASEYKKHLDRFFDESVWKAQDELLDPEDSHHYVNRKGCKHKTLVLQSRFDIPGIPKFMISELYFPLLPPFQQYMTLFHEVLYREAISRGHTDSVFVRKFNALLFSDQWDNSEAQALRLMKSHRFPKDYGDKL